MVYFKEESGEINDFALMKKADNNWKWLKSIVLF